MMKAYTLDRANEKWSISTGHIFIATAVYLYIFGDWCSWSCVSCGIVIMEALSMLLCFQIHNPVRK